MQAHVSLALASHRWAHSGGLGGENVDRACRHADDDDFLRLGRSELIGALLSACFSRVNVVARATCRHHDCAS